MAPERDQFERPAARPVEVRPLRRGHVVPAVLLAILLAVPSAGCNLFGKLSFKDDAAAIPKPPAGELDKEQIVEHLNQNIRKVQGWRSNNVTITAKQPGMIPISLSSSIAVERSRNFRLRVRSLLRGDETDFGSNSERFWFWMRESPQKVVFTARHENVHLVQARMHIPFDPDWLIESLGVVEIDPGTVSLERTDPTGTVVDLFEERILANGQRAKMATTVDTGRGLIVGRTLYDPAGGLVARATLLEHRVHEPDRADGGIVMPHEIKIEWPSAKTTLVMDVGRIDVNPSISELTFAMPTIPKCEVLEIDRGMPRREPLRVVMENPRNQGFGRGIVESPTPGERNFFFEDELADGASQPIQHVGAYDDGLTREASNSAPAEFDPAMFESGEFDSDAFDSRPTESGRNRADFGRGDFGRDGFGRDEYRTNEFPEEAFAPPIRTGGSRNSTPLDRGFDGRPSFDDPKYDERSFGAPAPTDRNIAPRTAPEPRTASEAWYD